MKQCKILYFHDGVSNSEKERVINSWLAKGYTIKGVVSDNFCHTVYLETI